MFIVLRYNMCTHFIVTKGMRLMADTYIKYNDHSISSAFKDHYIVPDYQREYVWTDEQVEQLMADLLDAYNTDNKKAYFLGTIVTYDSGSQFELIDGQQRLTTFFVLLCAIKKFYVNCGEQTSVIENLIYSPTMNSEGDVINLYHLQLQYEDAGNCLELIEKGLERPNYLTQSGERLFDAFKTIQDFLSERFPDIASLKKFVVFLLNKTSFIRIETYDISDALKIFETINQRGKGLDPMDLLKNMVFRQVDRSKFKELNMNWKSITRSLEKIDEKPLRFLRYFIMANYDTSSEKDGILREDQIYTWLSNNNAQCHYEEAPFQFVQKMAQNVELYVKCRMPDDKSEGNVHLKNIPLLAGKSYKLHLKLYYSTTSYFEKRQDFFICSTHRANKDKCSGHYIRAVVLEQIVWKHIQEVVSVVTRYEAYFRSEMEQKLRMQSEESLRLSQKRLAQAEKRIGELDRLFIRIYEDNVAGRLDDERFAMMSKNYTGEQKTLKAEVKGLQQQIHEQEQQAENIEQFVQRVKRNSTLTELTPYALRELVKAVYVDAPDKSSGKRRQKVHIEYDLVGYIPVDELLKAEQA